MSATLEPTITVPQTATIDDDLIQVTRSILDDFNGDPSAFFRASTPTPSVESDQDEKERREALAVKHVLKLRH